MKIGISLFFTDYSIDVAVFAREAERLGFDSLWVPEHPIMPVKGQFKWAGSSLDATLPSSMPEIPKVYADMVDPFVTLGRASAVTNTLKLGTGICLVPQRNPLLLAKEIATLDMYSKGRFILGIGAGGIREETEIMEGDFNRRWDQTREAILAMKELWSTVESEFHGEFYDFPPVYSFPRPTQRPHPPIYLGSVAKRVFERIVEYGDAWMPTRVSAETIKKGRDTLNKMCESAGRDPKAVGITVFGVGIGDDIDLDYLNNLRMSGADRVVIRVPSVKEKEALGYLDRIATKVL